MRISKRVITVGLKLLGIGGIGLTGYSSIKCNEKAKTKTTKKGKILSYLPAALIGLGSAGCFLGSEHINVRSLKKEIAVLTAGVGYLTANRKKIEEKIRKHLGDDKLKEVRQETGEALVKSPDTYSKHISWEYTGHGHTKFMDYNSGRYFITDFESVISAGRKINHDFSKGIAVCWNDWYDYIGIEKSRVGEDYIIPEDDEFGYEWNIDEPIMFDYIPVDEDDGTKIYIIYCLTKLRKEF